MLRDAVKLKLDYQLERLLAVCKKCPTTSRI